MNRMKYKASQMLQFSKRMSITVTIFWIVFRLVEILAAFWRPSISNALVQLVGGVDTVMMVNLGFYCGNSVAEKAILAWMDTKVKQNCETSSENIVYAIKNETVLDETEEDVEEEGGENG